MQYFVTGATGFIGKRLVRTLLERRGSTVYFLLRPESEGKVVDLLAYWGVTKARAIPVFGDLTTKKLGVAADDIKQLKGQIDHLYHLAAVYDLAADEESQVQVNIEGTRNAVEFAKAIDAGHLHHVSSIAAAGLYEGVFREDMFDEAEGLDHPYFMTKHESEKIVRTESKVPWTVYRPALVVGDSQTGEMDKIDGPYYFFKMNLFVNAALLGFIPKSVKKGMMALASVRRVKAAVLKDLGLPEDMLTFVNFPTRYDCRETLAALKGSGISCPKLDDYAWRLWD